MLFLVKTTNFPLEGGVDKFSSDLGHNPHRTGRSHFVYGSGPFHICQTKEEIFH